MTENRQALADLLRVVVDLCRFRRGPQDLEHAPDRLVMLLVASTVLDVLLGAALGESSGILARSFVSTALALGLCWMALAIRGMRSRYVQTATALVACSMVFAVIQLPLALIAGAPPENPNALSGAQVLLGWAMIVLLMWKLGVDAHIVRQAMDSPFALALALVTSWLIAYWAIDQAFFGTQH